MAYEDEVAALAQGYTSPLEHPEEDDADPGVSTLASIGSPAQTAAASDPPVRATPFGTGRFSQNGNELPKGLYNRERGTDPGLPDAMPDAQYAAATGATPPDPDDAGISTVAPGGGTAAAPDYAGAGFAGELSNLRQGDRTTRMMEATPSEAATIQPLQDAISAASVPVNPNQKGSKPGQPYQENYRPTVGQRILRGVQGYAKGGVLGAVNPGGVGSTPYGAPNDAFNQEVARRAAVVASTGQRLTQAQAAYKERQAQLKQQADAEQAQSLGYSRLPTGVAGQQNAASATARANSDQQRADQESPEGKAAALTAENTAKIANQRAAEQDRIGKLTGNDPDYKMLRTMPAAKRLQYVVEGTITSDKGREPTEAEIMYNRIANLPENKGKPLTAEHMADMVAQAHGQETPTTKTELARTRENASAAAAKVRSADAEARAAQTEFDKISSQPTRRDPKNPSGPRIPNPDYVAAKSRVEAAQQAKEDAMTALDAVGKAPETTAGGGGFVPPKQTLPGGEVTRRIRTADGVEHIAVARGGKWVDQTTGKPI